MIRFDPRHRASFSKATADLSQSLSHHRPQLRIVGKPPAELLPWLLARGSLTAKIEALTQQRLIVRPQFEGRQPITMAEKHDLWLSPSRTQSAWVRDALLYGHPLTQKGSDAWIMARSLFPFTSLWGDAKQLSNLGQTPIGYVMFGRGGARLLQRQIRLTSMGWQRTSLYAWRGRRLLVSEIFLPAFSDFLASMNLQH